MRPAATYSRAYQKDRVVLQGKADLHRWHLPEVASLADDGKAERRNIVESRLIVHIYRELRRKQLKLEKGKGSKTASVSVAQLKKNFPSLSNYEITSRLRDRCECQPLPVSPYARVCPSFVREVCNVDPAGNPHFLDAFAAQTPAHQ